MATTTIYVPDALWEELRPLVEAKRLNLSQVAARAAKQELERMQGEARMNATVRRLRAEKRGILGQAALARGYADEWLSAARYEDVEEMASHGVRHYLEREEKGKSRDRRLPPLPPGFFALVRPSAASDSATGPFGDGPEAPREVNLKAVLDAFDERIEEVWDEVEGGEDEAADR